MKSCLVVGSIVFSEVLVMRDESRGMGENDEEGRDSVQDSLLWNFTSVTHLISFIVLDFAFYLILLSYFKLPLSIFLLMPHIPQKSRAYPSPLNSSTPWSNCCRILRLYWWVKARRFPAQITQSRRRSRGRRMLMTETRSKKKTFFRGRRISRRQARMKSKVEEVYHI